MKPLICFLLGVLTLSACLSGCGAGGGEPDHSITVFAAASTQDVTVEAAAMFERTADVRVKVNLASSGALAHQIARGAEADVYISAHPRWMDDLNTRGLIKPSSRFNLMSNRLVFIAPKGQPVRIDIVPSFDFGRTFDGRLSIGDPEHVPVGIYAKQALMALGWWEAASSRLAPAADARAALRVVEMGEAGLGVAYASDAAASGGVEIVAAVPPSLHDPIVYPAALCVSHQEQAEAFLRFLASDEMGPILQRHGFTTTPSTGILVEKDSPDEP